ncbi:MAG: phosphate transporter, periplasmic phosphate-binding protein [Myxococcaceae bacterium]|nr:phosphate transporter, periplasmic phosphate-binding protein [Myxococcaceae bacterium]
MEPRNDHVGKLSPRGLGMGVALLVMSALGAVGCKGDSASSGPTPGAVGSGGTTSASGGGDVALNGSGSTFVNPILSKWVSEYQAKNKTKINYQPVGSGAGIKAITDKTVDFGATDAPMNDDQLAKAGGKILHIPLTLGAVVVTYNLKDAPPKLQLTPEVLAGIFSGEIKTWNDPKILAVNAGAKLPAQSIGVVYRSDGSGTTAVFTDYLSKVSPTWKAKVGQGTSVKWLTGTGANKNDGVANQIKQTPGAIGYVELAFARQTKQPVALLKNKAGKFVEPTLEGTTAAAAGLATKLPDDMRVSLTDADGEGAYPIAAFTYALVYEDTPSFDKGQALAKFLWWGIHDGQKLGPALDYAPLPTEVVTKAEAKLKSLKSGGKVLLTDVADTTGAGGK